VNEPIVRHCLE